MINRLCSLAIGTALILAPTVPAEQSAVEPGGAVKAEDGRQIANGDLVPKAEPQLKVLTEKLGLTIQQQAKIMPILKKLQAVTEKLARDKSRSREELLAEVRPYRYKADKKLREFLSDDQKKKLDQYEHGPHPEMHGNLGGATPSSQK
jgi:hypothetical protein